MKLEWSNYALSDRDGIFDYIVTESPRSAVVVDEAIRDHVRQLIDFPASGRPGRVAGTRELVITGLPYIAVYRLLDNRVRILRVIHVSQQWPDHLPQ